MDGDHSTRSDGIATALSVLGQRFGPQMLTGRDARMHRAHSATWLAPEPADAVLLPQNTNEVAEIVKICGTYNTPIIPFGTGTSLEGHVNAPLGGVSLDMSQMASVLQVNAEDLDCTVQPGITRKALNEDLRATGLFFPIDPGADASIGGMAATRASGTNAVRYGTMKDVVMDLQVVLANGEIIRTGTRAKKSSAGYDLTRLFVGSEGTLGVITELTLKLFGMPEAMSAATCQFKSVEAACEAVIATIQYGLPVARIELLDAAMVGAVNAYSNLSLPENPLLLLEFHGSEAGVAEQAQAFGSIAEDTGGQDFQWTTKPEDRTKLWQARHDAYWAARALKPGTEGISTDVCVPISKLAEAVQAAANKAAELNLAPAPILGHVGDGNFHVLLLVDPNDKDEQARAKTFLDWLYDAAISAGGTCTGEHGIGQGKQHYLRKELGPALEPMRAIKTALDPDNIMNPGKIFTLG
ncbi:MAG: FAD-linked oxidase C-terminal domain-containing protein [Pseudomonadota bacterium]